MPVQFDDAAQHAAGLPQLTDRVSAIFEAFRSRLLQVDGRDKLDRLVADFDQHRDLLVRTAVGDQSAVLAGRRGTLGPGETPYVAGDKPVSAADSERHSNPLAPFDSSGAKVHPADAASMHSKAVNPAGGLGFGGNGVGTSADVRTQATLAARDLPTRSLQEQELASQTERQPGAATDDGAKKNLIPVIENEIVAGSEREQGGVRYVTKRRQDGTEYEAIDARPLNAPV